MKATSSLYPSVRWILVIVALACLALGVPAMAQITTQTTTTQGQSTTQSEIKRGEVVYVSGNDLVVKMEAGDIKHFHVPETARFHVDNQDLTVHDLKPGMQLTQTVTTTTTPTEVKTVTTAKGKVFYVAGDNVILAYPNGEHHQYKVPEGTKFNINGEEKTVSELKKGMNVTATVVKTIPSTEVSTASSVSGTAPAPPPAPETPAVTASAPMILEEEATTPAAPEPAQTAENKPAKLPQTASNLPLVAFFGVLWLAAGIALAGRRRKIA